MLWGMWDLRSCGILVPDRDWTHARALDVQSLNHWTAREVWNKTLKINFKVVRLGIEIVRCLEENIFHVISTLNGRSMTIAKFMGTNAGNAFSRSLQESVWGNPPLWSEWGPWHCGVKQRIGCGLLSEFHLYTTCLLCKPRHRTEFQNWERAS